MPNKFYIKLYLEFLDDPKIGMMSDKYYRNTVEFFLLAGTVDNEGLLPNLDEMSWRLRRPTDEILLSLQALSTVGIIHETKEGWFVTKYATRQAPQSGADRTRRHRKRKQKQLYYGDDNVTEGETKPSRNRNTELKLELELDKELNGSEKIEPEPEKPELEKGENPNPKEQLIIDKSLGGDILKKEMDKARDSKGRGPILYYANAQQRDEFLKVFDILGSADVRRFIRMAIIRERESRSSILAFLQKCARNKKTEMKRQMVNRTSAQQTLTQLEKK